MPIRTALETPRTKARLRWAATLRVGIDWEESLGLSPGLTTALITGAEAVNKLAALNSVMIGAGSIEAVALNQKQKVKPRYALNTNPLISFQTVQQQIAYTLIIQRVVLKRLPEVEAVFNFLPSNLVHQQFPFIIELTDAGDGTTESEIKHLCFGCRFSDSNVKYDILKSDDSRLIQNAEITVGRVVTFDPSSSGNPAAQFFGGLINSALATSAGETLMENLKLV